MRVAVGDVSLDFDVEGCGLAAQGDAMLSRPTLLLLHGGPGADHSLFKPEFSVLADVAQVIYLVPTSTATQVEVLAGVGHGVFRQAPQKAFDALRTFLRDIPPA